MIKRLYVKDMVEVVRVTLVNSNTESRLITGLESLIETTQDFTDSAYTSHDHRQQILMICEQLRHQTSVVIRIGASLVSTTLLLQQQQLLQLLLLLLLL